jgi:hypothetical protein
MPKDSRLYSTAVRTSNLTKHSYLYFDKGPSVTLPSSRYHAIKSHNHILGCATVLHIKTFCLPAEVMIDIKMTPVPKHHNTKPYVE